MERGPIEFPTADIETVYIRRVHEVVQYLVPVYIHGRNFGKSRLPLIQAVGQGDLHWVRQILLKTDTDPNTRSWKGWTALQHACYIETGSPESKNQEAIVRLLISHGADVNSAPGLFHGRTALQAACKKGNEKIVDLLLENGADVNEDVAPVDGQSSLAYAVEAGGFGIVKKLLDRGAYINQPGSEPYRNTALSAAAEEGNLEMLDYLIENEAITKGPAALLALTTAIVHNQLDIARCLLEKALASMYPVP
ncbi:hypothetical protein AG0111_0g7872 [Alternaria gaisen]|uniref:Uncharacterized protein n=1 Tax=Alternaria gaisen TaxID=167740 RepID=A0ACB6FHR4_9PLEO|nr:hypothetical protein AG0111_0g7872 [Alternaria gaisen]